MEASRNVVFSFGGRGVFQAADSTELMNHVWLNWQEEGGKATFISFKETCLDQHARKTGLLLNFNSTELVGGPITLDLMQTYSALQFSRKNKIRYVSQTQLYLMNSILHCYMFRLCRSQWHSLHNCSRDSSGGRPLHSNYQHNRRC